MKKINGGIMLFCLILGTGCAPMKEIDIRVMEPADLTLPLNVQALSFLNRSIMPNLLHPDTSGWTDEEYYILDTIMNNWIFKGIGETMMASPLYDLDTLEIIRSRQYGAAEITKPMSPGQMQQLKRIHPADAVISLEYYDLNDSSSVYVIMAGNESGYTEYALEAYLGLYTTAVWRIYDLIRDTVFDEHIIRDTLTWYHVGETVDMAVAGLPRSTDAIRSAAYSVGSRYGERISPTWLETPRYYHASGGRDMRLASKKAGEEDWRGAAEIWKDVARGEKPRIAAHACFNMALVCEMDDLILQALDWAIKSYSIRQETLTREYIDLLKQRYGKREKLDKQIPVGTD